jgi:hypothetical protein
MKALFLGHFAATVAPRILAKVKTPLETSILDAERGRGLFAHRGKPGWHNGSGAVFEAPGLVAGFDDFAVMSVDRAARSSSWRLRRRSQSVFGLEAEAPPRG